MIWTIELILSYPKILEFTSAKWSKHKGDSWDYPFPNSPAHFYNSIRTHTGDKHKNSQPETPPMQYQQKIQDYHRFS